jgi:predicted DNA-binding transcriptional regulator AlpA
MEKHEANQGDLFDGFAQGMNTRSDTLSGPFPKKSAVGAGGAKCRGTGVKNGKQATPENAPARTISLDAVFVDVRAVAVRYRVSKATIWRWASGDGSFPKPMKLSKGTTRWLSADLDAYDRSLRRAKTGVPSKPRSK